MNRTKEVFDSGFTLDDIFQESIDLNNLVLSNKSNETKYENILKFFSNNFKLRNVSKRIYYNKSDLNSKVKTIYNFYFSLL
jgi:hypothetical protein